MTVAFTLLWVTTHELRLALTISLAVTVGLRVPDGSVIKGVRFYYYDESAQASRMSITSYDGAGNYTDHVLVEARGLKRGRALRDASYAEREAAPAVAAEGYRLEASAAALDAVDARLRALDFSWDEILSRLLDSYREVLREAASEVGAVQLLEIRPLDVPLVVLASMRDASEERAGLESHLQPRIDRAIRKAVQHIDLGMGKQRAQRCASSARRFHASASARAAPSARGVNTDFYAGLVKELRKESKREGMEGISPRYVQDKISNALVSEVGEGTINPFMVMNELEEGLSHHSLITDEELKKEYKELLAVVREEYEDILKAEVQRAISADEDAIKRLATNYIESVRAYTQHERVRNRYTGRDEDPDERLMRSIEEKIDIPESRKDDFRQEIMNYIGALALDGKKFEYNTNARLLKALELKLFEDQRDTIKLKNLVSSVVDDETQQKIDIVKQRLIKYFGYNETSATDVLNYVASIFARGDAKGTVELFRIADTLGVFERMIFMKIWKSCCPSPAPR